MSTATSKGAEMKTGGVLEKELSRSEHSIKNHHGYCMDGFVVGDYDDSDGWKSEESDDEYEYSDREEDEEDEEDETESMEEKEEHDLDEELDKEDLELIWTYFKDRAATCHPGRKRKHT